MLKRQVAIPFIVCWLGGSLTVAAQTQPDAVDANSIELLLDRVAELEREVKQLREISNPSRDAGESPAPQSAQDARGSHDHGGDLAGASNPGSAVSPIPEIHWFGDVGYRASDLQGDTDSFSLGQLDLFMTSTLTDRLNILSEVVFRPGTDNKYAVNAERLLLRYSPSPYLAVSVGRYHTAIGFYNTAYHHGSWFETAVARPAIFAYRGGLIPIHDVGVIATGRVPSGRLGLSYTFELGNGQSSQSSASEPTQNSIDENDGKAVNVGISARPEMFAGLELGFSAHHDKLYPSGAPSIDQRTLAAHVVYQSSTFEWLNEIVAVLSARPAPATDTSTTGFYSQVSRQFADVRPYFRYQYVDANQADSFRALGHRYGPTIGVRYDLGKFAAVKGQYERTARRGLPVVNAVATQLAFIF
jgi:hypothetical protein